MRTLYPRFVVTVLPEHEVDPGVVATATPAGDRVRRRPPPVPLVLGLLVAKLLVVRLLVFGVPAPMMVLADLAAAAVLVGLVALLAPGPATSPALWALDVVVTVFLTVAVLFHSYYQTLPTFTALHEADQADDIRGSIVGLLDWRLAVLYVDLVLAPFIGLAMLGPRWRPTRARSGRDRWLRLGVLVGAGSLATAIFLHSAADIRNEQFRAEQVGVLGYELDTVARALRPAPTLDLATAYDRVAELKATDHTTVTDPALARGFGTAAGKNLIMVQLESMQEFVIGLEVGGQEVTPNLNELAGQSYYFPRHFQQVGKGNTVDAEFLTNTSIYPVGDVAMSTGYGDRDLPSLPKLLRERGYVSETFNVNWAHFWDHDKLFAGLGFDRWHEKDEFPGPKFNYWGVSDQEFYGRSLARLVELAADGQPFYTQLVTASGHGPFEVPEDLIGLDLPADLADTEVGKYLQAQNYADRALGLFIRGLKQTGLWDTSLFVTYGDHGGLNEEETVDGVRALGVRYDFLQRFNTPLIIHAPGAEPSREQQVAGELDILPTVANLLGISLAEERFVAFGSDLLNTDAHTFGTRFHAPTGTFFGDDARFVPGRGFADGEATSLTTGRQRPLDGLRADYDYVLDLMDLSDAYVESLPRR